jgi:chromate transporter
MKNKKQKNAPNTFKNPSISLKEASLFWLKLGFISFGGPAGQIALMHQELVEKRQWISEQRFLHALNYCMLLPGPEAQQLATYLGWLMHRTRGGCIAGLLFILPSLVLLICLSWLYLRHGQRPEMVSILYGVKAAITAIVIFAAYRIGARALKNHVLRVIALASFLTLTIFNVPFPVVVFVALSIGTIGGYLKPHYFTLNKHSPTSQNAKEELAFINDNSPMESHMLFSGKRLIKTLFWGIFLWAGVAGYLYLHYGPSHPLTEMAFFFSKAALLTFGGAYAVLPYVYQAAIEQYHWLTTLQMMDGLALGETTPGPLIMIVTFVGFLGGWQSLAITPGSEYVWGIIGAFVATYFTFLPSFLFIFAGAPLIESTHGNLKFTAPLSAMTATVVGVILNLGLFFAQHIFFPQGLEADMDMFAAFISIGALIALIRFKVNIISVIIGCGAVGWLHAF